MVYESKKDGFVPAVDLKRRSRKDWRKGYKAMSVRSVVAGSEHRGESEYSKPVVSFGVATSLVNRR